MNDLHFGVAIGINRYPGIKDLEHARSDAEAFFKWLTNPEEGGVPPEQAHLIEATQDEEKLFASIYDARPLRHEVDHTLLQFHKELRERLRSEPSRRRETRLYLYVAGHGVAPSGGRGALLFADAEPAEDYWGGHLDLLQYELFYEKCGIFREVVLLSDCCRETFAGIPPATQPFRECTRPEIATRVVVGYATAMADKAGEPISADVSEVNGRGFFTKALLAGLRGGPAHPTTGVVDDEGLASYVRKTVTELAAEVGYEQAAEIRPSGERLVLTTVPVRQYRIELLIPDDWPGDEILLGRADEAGDAAPFDSWRGVGPARWVVELPNSIYHVRSTTGRTIKTEVFVVEGASRNVEL
jgi:uncharacterized caspase-like protein